MLSEWWQIGTRLIGDEEVKEWEKQGLVPKLAGSNVYFEKNFEKNYGRDYTLTVDKPLYLNVPYDKLDEYLNKTYEGECFGVPFSYRLTRNRLFIEEIEEKILYRTASLYNINRPLIFAPEARRAVDICIIDGLTPDKFKEIGKYKIDANMLKEAGWKIDILGGLLLTNKRLILSNVKLSPNPEDFANDGEEGRYVDAQKNIPPKTFILPDTLNIKKDVREIELDEEGKPFRVYLSKDADLRKYYTLTFGDANEGDWINIKAEKKIPTRLRTAADIDELCECFKDESHGFNAKFKCVKEPNETLPQNIIRRYERQDRYPDFGEAQELFKMRRYRPVCYLEFETDGDKTYLFDYAEYVLSACEREYPEFSWAGVADDF